MNAIFLKVDVDRCADTAAALGVNAMPTFIFYRNKIKLDTIQGADPQKLENKIQTYYIEEDVSKNEETIHGHVRYSVHLISII